MAGHSLGAEATQVVSGEALGLGGTRYADARIKAAIAMSPSSPSSGNAQRAFSRVAIPCLLMTGTRDVAPIGEADAASRLAVYEALPAGGKYELVLDGAEHAAFSDLALPGAHGARDPNHHRTILALSSAFWDAYLRGDAAARAWLDGSGARSLLAKGDQWLRK
jgi:predicted dienelactone hydrolase